MFGIVIEKKTNLVVDKCVIVEEYNTSIDEEVIEYDYKSGNPIGGMNKPQWIGTGWIDIDPLPPVEVQPQEPTPQEQLQILGGQVATLEVMGAGLLLENANQQVKIQEQEVTNANMLLELASLKGGM